jgi:hypothetical protein
MNVQIKSEGGLSRQALAAFSLAQGKYAKNNATRHYAKRSRRYFFRFCKWDGIYYEFEFSRPE